MKSFLLFRMKKKMSLCEYWQDVEVTIEPSSGILLYSYSDEKNQNQETVYLNDLTYFSKVYKDGYLMENAWALQNKTQTYAFRCDTDEDYETIRDLLKKEK
jgi:hypothetical protein